MKNFQYFIYGLIIAALATPVSVAAQDKKSGAIEKAIKAKDYTFKARTANPASGRTIQLTSDYTFTVKDDSLVAHLPYFGRAYTAPIGRTTGGIEFTSTDYQYDTEKDRKGGWRITIKPNDTQDLTQLFLTVSKNGYATLHVNSQNRQAISFSGVIEK